MLKFRIRKQAFKSGLLLVLLLSAFYQVSAQSLANTTSSISWLLADLDRIYPKHEFIERKIRTVEIEFGLKRDNARIEKSGKKIILTYNRQAKIESLIEVNRTEYGFDSLFTFHYYINDNKMHISRKFMSGKYFATYENLDADGRVTRILECLETNLSGDFRFFKLGTQQILRNESFQYEELNDNQLRKKYLNDNGVVYKEGIIHYDKKKNVKEEDYSYNTTGIRENITNVYNEQGRMTETYYSSDAAGDIREATRFTYEGNKLSGEKYYRNNVLKGERFYFFNAESGVLESVLSKNAGDYNIEIFNISISFFD